MPTARRGAARIGPCWRNNSLRSKEIVTARILGGLAISHTPTIGFAVDHDKQDEAAWAPVFKGFDPIKAWLKEQQPDVLFYIFNDHVPYPINYDAAAPTKTTAGVAISTTLTYPNAFGTRASLIPELGINRGLYGSPAGVFPGFAKNVGSVTTALNVDFKTDPGLTARIDFTHFYGGGESNPMLDKDYLGLSLTTSF